MLRAPSGLGGVFCVPVDDLPAVRETQSNETMPSQLAAA